MVQLFILSAVAKSAEVFKSSVPRSLKPLALTGRLSLEGRIFVPMWDIALWYMSISGKG